MQTATTVGEKWSLVHCYAEDHAYNYWAGWGVIEMPSQQIAERQLHS